MTSGVNFDLVKQMDDKKTVTVVHYIDGTSVVVQGSLETILAAIESCSTREDYNNAAALP